MTFLETYLLDAEKYTVLAIVVKYQLKTLIGTEIYDGT